MALKLCSNFEINCFFFLAPLSNEGRVQLGVEIIKSQIMCLTFMAELDLFPLCDAASWRRAELTESVQTHGVSPLCV